MKRSVFIRIMAVLLVVCLAVPTTLSAAAFGQNGSRTSWFQNQWESMIEQITGWFRPEGNNEIVPTEATTATTEATTAPTEATAAPTEAATEPAVDPTEETETPEHLVLESADSQVVHPEMLRAATYNVVAPKAGETRKTFPITMYNYDERINEATHQAELKQDPNLTQWNGIYFTDGSPAAESYGESVPATNATGMVNPKFNGNNAQIVTGDYYIYSLRAKAFLTKDGTGLKAEGNHANATKWTVTKNGNNYTIQNGSSYLNIDRDSAGTSGSSVSLQMVKGTKSKDSNALMIKYEKKVFLFTTNYYLNFDSGKPGFISVDKQQDGNDFYLIEASKIAQFEPGHEAINPVSHEFASHNWWTGKTKGNGGGPFKEPSKGIDAGDRVFSGMVQPDLTSNGDIQFNYPQGGIFDSNKAVKDIYSNVEMPFQYDSKTNTYTFDSAKDSAHFAGNPASNTALASFNGPQCNHFETAVNKEGYGWYPFNDAKDFQTAATDYHFGAKMTVPFSMTKNGCLKENDDKSTPIKFNFSGDDDVWVFIDGKLVLDLGGIHNAVDGELNFATNTWSITAAGQATEDAVKPKETAMSGKIFNEGTEDGALKQDRATFAAQSTHQLTIFYLERGQGSSNCKISFNLPFFDTLTVMKNAGRKLTTKGNEVKTEPLTDAELAQVEKINFGFTLFKQTATGEFSPVSNAAYNLLNENNQVVSSLTTDKDGHFVLKHQQSAQFRTQFNGKEGTRYYVVEDPTPGFVDPRYHFSIKSSGNSTVENTTPNPQNDKDLIQNERNLESSKVHVIDSEESEGSVVIACVNYLNNDLADPSVSATNQRIVLDYGLDVMIDPMDGVTHKGTNLRLYGIGNETYKPDLTTNPDTDPNAQTVTLNFGTATIEKGNKIRYHLDRPLTDVEVLTYAVAVDRSAGSGNKEEHAYSTATIYIIPATSMYYEESFNGLVTLNGDWKTVEGTSLTETQEPGEVGNIDDSPYGSDVYYKGNTTDSCGSYSHVNVANAGAKFEYTFTGDGTTFFARTSENSAYMRVRITGDNGVNDTFYRDTRYDSKQTDGTTSKVNGPLYNIPVFTWGGEYGTYKVEVSLANVSLAPGYGTEFYLDGIRVMNPLNPVSKNLGVAESAYAVDGEANMTYVTLRDKMLTDATTAGPDGNPEWNEEDKFVSFTDTNGKLTTASEYKSIGPKEELYLYGDQNGKQSVSFALKNWDPDTNRLYLGMKAPQSNAKVKIGSNTYNVNNTVDCYYLLKSGDYEIKTGSDNVQRVVVNIQSLSGLISLTNIKVTGTPDFAIVGNSTNEEVPIPPDADVVVPGDQEVPAPNAVVIEPVVEETTAPETTVTEPVAEETTAPETTVTEPVDEETTAPETTVNEPVVEETTAPDTAAEQVTEEVSAPDAEVHETTNP